MADAATSALAAHSGADRAVVESLDVLADRLERHHRAEDAFFFPAFRAGGRLAPDDAEFIDGLDAEHEQIEGLVRSLSATSGRLRSGVGVASVAVGAHRDLNELVQICRGHFASEEQGMTPAFLSFIITPSAMSHVYVEMKREWRTR